MAKKAVDLKAVRRAVADYMASEGCTCCRDIEAHDQHKAKLAELLGVPTYEDGSGFNFIPFRSEKQRQPQGAGK